MNLDMMLLIFTSTASGELANHIVGQDHMKLWDNSLQLVYFSIGIHMLFPFNDRIVKQFYPRCLRTRDMAPEDSGVLTLPQCWRFLSGSRIRAGVILSDPVRIAESVKL